MDRPTHAGLGHLALNVHDLEAMTRFYVDLLGFAVVWAPDADNVYLSSGRDNLALHRVAEGREAIHAREAFAPETPGREAAAARSSPLDHLGILVEAGDDVDRWAAFLESRGVTLAARPRTHRDGSRSCYLSDPEGNRIQILKLGIND